MLIATLIAIILVVVVTSYISFSVYSSNAQLAKIHATATAHARNGSSSSSNANPYPPNTGTLTFHDTLTSDTADHGAWTVQGPCEYGTDNTYHVVTSTPNYPQTCPRQANGAWNDMAFAYEVQMNITQGDCGGLTIGMHAGGDFLAYIVCSNGKYAFTSCTATACTQVIQPTPNTYIPAGTNRQMTLAIVYMSGEGATLYVNGQPLTKYITLGSYSGGGVGLLAFDEGHATDVSYSKMRLWTM